MSEEAKKEEKSTEHINLKVVGQDGQTVHFKIKKHTSLKKLMNAYCDRSKLAVSTVRFRFDGQPVTENDTPQGLEMEDGDTIEVFQQQTGGGGGRRKSDDGDGGGGGGDEGGTDDYKTKWRNDRKIRIARTLTFMLFSSCEAAALHAHYSTSQWHHLASDELL